MSKAVCAWCRTLGYIGQECPQCFHSVGVPRDRCTCRSCARQCRECKGTGQRQGFFGTGFCVRCDGTGRA